MPRKGLPSTFQGKCVVELNCRYCGSCVCDRGMKAILLADTNIELFSTDLPPSSSVDFVSDSYCTEKCRCHIKDVACLGCGNVVGYTVVLPCPSCLASCNNGHFWMFHSAAVEAQNRIDKTGSELLVWGKLEEKDYTEDSLEDLECIR